MRLSTLRAADTHAHRGRATAVSPLVCGAWKPPRCFHTSQVPATVSQPAQRGCDLIFPSFFKLLFSCETGQLPPRHQTGQLLQNLHPPSPAARPAGASSGLLDCDHVFGAYFDFHSHFSCGLSLSNIVMCLHSSRLSRYELVFVMHLNIETQKWPKWETWDVPEAGGLVLRFPT